MNTPYKQLFRSRTDRMIAGLCAGLGEYANIDPTVVRLLFVLAFFLTGPGIVLAYLIMALIIPEEPVGQAQQ
jgi:phage shock protein PspC (stress-responsive transcriptional regulator)